MAAHGWLISESKVKRYRIALAVLVDEARENVIVDVIADVNYEKIELVLSEQAYGTINEDLVELIIQQADDNLLASTGTSATKKIGDMRGA